MCMIQALSYIVMDISSAKSSGPCFFIQQQTLAALTMCWLLILCFAIVCGYCYAKCCNKSSVQSLSDKDVVFWPTFSQSCHIVAHTECGTRNLIQWLLYSFAMEGMAAQHKRLCMTWFYMLKWPLQHWRHQAHLQWCIECDNIVVPLKHC